MIINTIKPKTLQLIYDTKVNGYNGTLIDAQGEILIDAQGEILIRLEKGKVWAYFDGTKKRLI